MDNITPVLDHGYVRLAGVFGDDLMVVNAARVSYGKSHSTFTAGDRRLIRYLWTHDHRSPFYHPKLQFEVRAPLLVTRQWQRHIVDSTFTTEGVAINEQSRRYTQDDLEFYLPAEWRQPDEANKQASRPAAASRPDIQAALAAWMADGVAQYHAALASGVAPEQARLFLPANAQYTTWYWTASLFAVLHFWALRQGEAAQWEIQQYATVVGQAVHAHFPETWAVAGGPESAETAT